VTVRIALAGFGYWGPNLARNFASLDGVVMHTVCDLDPERLHRAERQHPGARMTSVFHDVLEDPEVDAVVVATPVHTHHALSLQALEANKHVMVEKPLAQTSAQGREMIETAEARGLTLLVGHVFLYNPAVRQIREYIRSGTLGDIHYIYSQRLNLGIVRRDVNALWNFGPHDISIVNYWLEAAPESVIARGYSYIQPGIEDVVFMTLDYPGNIGVNAHISWLDPRKVRRMTIVGSEKMLVYDDVDADARVVIYDKGISREGAEDVGGDGASLGRFESFGEFQLLVRAGDVLIPKLEFAEPMKIECQHFVHCIRTGERPLSDGLDGLRVVQALEAAQRSMEGRGTLVSVET
jgi:predicted dehydrogenase